jgi:hypothetical protein
LQVGSCQLLKKVSSRRIAAADVLRQFGKQKRIESLTTDFSSDFTS